VQSSRSSADHHDLFLFLRRFQLHFLLVAERGIDQALHPPLAEDGLHAGVAGNAHPNVVQSAFLGFIRHLGVGEKTSSHAHQIGLALPDYLR
jgi:hypothetical protein